PAEGVRRAAAVPGDGRRRPRSAEVHREGARPGRSRGGGCRHPRPDTAHPSGGARRGLRRRLDAALRRAAGLWGTARGVLRDEERVRPAHARPYHRRLGRRAGPPPAADGAADARNMNFRRIAGHSIGVALDETTTPEEVRDVLAAFAGARPVSEPTADDTRLPRSLLRKSGYLGHPVFNTHHSETEMLRYMRL